MYRRFFYLSILTVGIYALFLFNGGLPSFWQPPSVQAVGDLLIDWDVPVSGDPIFTEADFKPGDMQTHLVTVTNTGTATRTVGVRGIKTDESKNLSAGLILTISANSTDLYGGTSTSGNKTLKNFFNESSGPLGIPLSELGPSDAVVYTFKVEFPTAAGDAYQTGTLEFDLQIGITDDVPAECLGIGYNGEVIYGTSGRDRLRGTSRNDLIFGLENRDRINGGGGNDCILGGEGNDRIDGDSGQDVIFGGAGDDRLYGGGENDQIFGEEGDDRIKGRSGDDEIDGGPGNDRLEGQSGNDEILGGPGDDRISGGSGHDTLDGEEDYDRINGGSGIDTCIGESITRCE